MEREEGKQPSNSKLSPFRDDDRGIADFKRKQWIHYVLSCHFGDGNGKVSWK